MAFESLGEKLQETFKKLKGITPGEYRENTKK